MLEVREFGVAFGDRVVIDSASFRVEGTGCTVLLGPSGTGKSTLLRTLSGFNDASPSLRTWGEAEFAAGHNPALVMQHSRLLVSDVQENLVCNMPDRGALTRMQQVERMRPLLESVGWQHLLVGLSRKVVECSLAEQRGIAILRAALSGARLIMIDEPTAGLGEADASTILDLIEGLSTSHAILLVLHNLMETLRVADHVVLLANGRIQEAGPAADFFAAPASECGRLFLRTGSCPEESRATPEELEEPVATVAADEAPAVAANPIIVPESNPVRHVSAAAGPRGFLWVLPGQLAGTPWPGVVLDTDFDLAALKSVGVTCLIALTEHPFDGALAARYGIRCLHSPMADMHPPTEEQAWNLCRHIQGLILTGEVVAVHCRAGLGRTGTVLTAYWLWRARGQLSALKALEHLRRIEPLWVQSPRQVAFLEKFAAAVEERARSADFIAFSPLHTCVLQPQDKFQPQI